ncbi:hypothetical protein [Pelagerythrobacter rhizovicinus]|uniref:Lipopolysaccharide biosynthesis protein n=1 Tax=Pelagerythrobacter rhizovicinus TaxID=2268576 RepID=A0A4V1QW33_9SPHN|nr:hypothetical protein [Pelagerythrobacter rhizovicinus]RXZ64756.1 hypothetical protein ETX26_12890 [Pelagerythrobacter rhizovicinus]
MLRLLFQRGVTLLLRPAALLAEGFLIPDANVLVFVLPAAAMALTLSSIPVHLDFFRMASHATSTRVERNYISGLIILSFISIVLLAGLLFLSKSSLGIGFAIIATFISEKFADELTRFYEFNKKYSLWFVAQMSRSMWLFIPIGLALAGIHYIISFCALASVAAVVLAWRFFSATGLRPVWNRGGFMLIKANVPFLGSSALLACHRQVPRLFVAFLFPQVAHVFQALAQLGQGVSLIFNVRYQIPYRKVIARRPLTFERLFRRPFLRIGGLSLVGAALGLIIGDSSYYSIGAFAWVGLGIAMLADALAFSLLATYLGLMSWFLAPSQALPTLLKMAVFFLVAFFSTYGAWVFLDGPLVLAPIFTTLLSLGSIALIKGRHLDGKHHA